MYYQTGNMRNLNPDSPSRNSQYWEQDDEYNHAQRSKFDRSQLSQPQQQRSRVIYQQQKSQRYQKPPEVKQINRVIPVKIKSPDRGQEYIVNLRLQMGRISDKNNNFQNINLTDDNDSLFLWSFFIREAQYVAFKEQQGLKVDFQDFPQVVYEYIEFVDPNSEKQIHPYKAVFEIKKGSQQAQFKFLQERTYKESLILLLKFRKANDEQQKNYLSQKYDKEKKESTRLSGLLSDAQHKLNLRMQELEKLNVEYEQLEKEKNARISELEKRERERIKEVSVNLESEYLNKHKAQQERNNQRINELTTKLEELKAKNEELNNSSKADHEKIIELQKNQNILKMRNSMLEQQYESFQKQNKELKAKQLKMNEEYHTLKNENTKLLCTIESLEDKVKEKDQRLTENTEIKYTNVNQISTLEENLRAQKKKIQKLQEKNENLQAELSKLKDKYDQICNKYQKKKDQFAQSRQVIKLQQQKVTEKQKEIKELLQEIIEYKRQKQNFELQLKDKDSRIDELKRNIQTNNQHIEDQKKIISSLNQKLNEKAIGGFGVKPNYNLAGTIPTYANRASTSTVGTLGRDFSSTISSNTESSRLRISPAPTSTSPFHQKVPSQLLPYKIVKEGIQNDRDQENSRTQTHSRSPLTRLNQQQDPQQVDKTLSKAFKPVKFQYEK